MLNLVSLDFVGLAPVRLARRARGLRFEGIVHPVLLRSPFASVGAPRRARGSPLMNASKAATGMILRRPTLRLASSRREISVATIRIESPRRREDSGMLTAMTLASICSSLHATTSTILRLAAGGRK